LDKLMTTKKFKNEIIVIYLSTKYSKISDLSKFLKSYKNSNLGQNTN